MFPYLDFGAAAFVLAAGFAFGLLFGWWLTDSRSRPSSGGDGGDVVPVESSTDVVGSNDPRHQRDVAEVIPFPGRRKAG